jgi:hypothetical protein
MSWCRTWSRSGTPSERVQQWDCWWVRQLCSYAMFTSKIRFVEFHAGTTTLDGHGALIGFLEGKSASRDHCHEQKQKGKDPCPLCKIRDGRTVGCLDWLKFVCLAKSLTATLKKEKRKKK